MKQILQFCIVLMLTMLIVSTSDAQWRCLYATWDDADSNGTGYRTSSVGVIRENMFIALVVRNDDPNKRNFMIPFDSFHQISNFLTSTHQEPRGLCVKRTLQARRDFFFTFMSLYLSQ